MPIHRDPADSIRGTTIEQQPVAMRLLFTDAVRPTNAAAIHPVAVGCGRFMADRSEVAVWFNGIVSSYDNRVYALSQWRLLRTYICPLGGVLTAYRTHVHRDRVCVRSCSISDTAVGLPSLEANRTTTWCVYIYIYSLRTYRWNLIVNDPLSVLVSYVLDRYIYTRMLKCCGSPPARLHVYTRVDNQIDNEGCRMSKRATEDCPLYFTQI